MNSAEQAADLCNSKTKNNSTAQIMPSESLLLMDGDVGRQVDEDNLDSVEVNGNKSGLFHVASTATCSNLDDGSFDQNPRLDHAAGSRFSTGARDDDGDMDIGVDLTLDESGVLEPEPLVPSSARCEVSASAGADLQPDSREAEESSGSRQEETPSDTPVTEESPTQEEGEKHKPGAKRVTFPSDEDIVSGAVEPKDPWRHAQNVTVEEILSAYIQACQKLNCKPIPKILKQIQELTQLTQRNECLDLKGEKLDYKACEALEEILKRVQFKLVDLEQTSLDEDGASALFDMIEYYESATHLNISFNKHIGSRGWQAAAHMMRKTSSLQYLDARNTPLLDHSAPFVARALRISSSLAVLHLENAGLSGRPLMLLATALKMNLNLKELYLADNKLNGLQDSAQLGNLLKFNYNIKILDLRNNHILDSGLAYLCEGLKEQRKGLVTLVLWNNQLTHNGMGYLAAALPCTQSLETLNLGHNSVGNEGVHKLKDGLIANRSVLRLGLASTKLSCEGAVAVAEFIAESPRLLRLDLRENEIKTGGLMALSLALKVNTSLLRLDLDREPKKETVKSFIETQRALLSEIQNGCKRNFIQAREKEETEQKMRQSASMAEISTEDTAREEEEEEEERGAASAEQTTEGEEEGDDEAKVTSNDDQEPQNQTPVMSIEDSDSDTEEEEDEEVTTKSPPLVAPPGSTPTASPKSNPIISTAHTIPSPPVSNLSGVTVTNAPLPPGTPPTPGRCISVSSPGRGHKIFMVTRVESPPEQPQQRHPTDHSVSDANKAASRAPPATSLQQQPARTTEHQEDLRESRRPLESESERTVELEPLNQTEEQRAVQNHSNECQTEGPAGSPGDLEPVGAALPNGLKPEFALHLLDPEGPKPGSCVMEHGESVTAELHCGQELEELLLEASLDTGRDT
uniref:Protein phosphatase 1 regulatory subunit 37 n=1 Tax=Denticeps clupeoides TaxID=299321 RepID=A0AAY4C7S1_9TELE